ncbi:hypothetical protein I9W82_001192 [Candida metapsilosis]|uniref:Aminopeptidase n=1 Tax=Candida metapsilosis TaxID=273372 RepID=A0A8H7ZKH8_9ASCO|nr:hypothetical protein I9W82_001192 [Candida metapsilosis]
MTKNTAPYYEALPTNLKPVHYDVSIADINLANDTFKGVVEIQLDVVEPTNELHLNYRDLSVSKENVEITYSDEKVLIESLTEYKSKEYFIIKLGSTLESGKVLVKINYDGIIQTNMAGFYKSAYLENGVEKSMLSTQFEATDARRAFPCLDEPLLKATFKVRITAQSDWTIISNTPIESEKEASNGLQTVEFEKTPIMSTYLLAWACGDFEYVESFTKDEYNGKPLPVRIYTTKGYIHEAQLASEITPKIVDYFSKVFQIKYPLPKLDLIAVHAFSHNAMENWGLITYRSTALLFNETKSAPSYKQKVAYVIAHELAHQWFGNLVTMKWWDELWLNEGFATWVGFLAVDYLYPEWDIFSEFVSESLEQALELDGLRNSHPIEVPVVDALDIDQVFDAISYLKGASTILMISKYLGTELFLEGVSLYLSKNKYGNATSHDLWASVGEVSGKPIDKLMNTWIKRVGFPLVNVEAEKQQQLILSQSRFLNGGDVAPSEDESVWWVPLNAKSDAKITLDSFDKKKVVVDNVDLKDGKFIINSDTAGFYRVKYSDEILNQNVIAHFNSLTSKDKMGIVADSAVLACAGNNSTTNFLQLVEQIVPQLGDDYVVWLELGKKLSQFSIVFATEETSSKINEFLKSVYSEKAISIIKELKSGGESQKSDFIQTKFRSEILNKAGKLQIPQVYEYALSLFNSNEPIQPWLRPFVYSTIASSPNFTLDQFNQILKLVTHPDSLDSREVALAALGSVTNKSISSELIPLLAKPDVVPTMDAHFLGQRLSSNSATRDEFLKFFLNNYDASIYKIMSTNMVVLDRFVKMTLKNFQSLEKLNEIDDFFKTRDVHGFERALKQSLDHIRINANWYARDIEEVKKFLEKY